jgi:hypothetical protein
MKLKATLAATSVALATAFAGPAMAQQQRPYPPGALKNLASQIVPPPGNGPLVQQPARVRAGTLNGLGNEPIGAFDVHASDCVWVTPDGVNNLLFVISAEGEVFAILNNPIASATADAACVNGNILGGNVIDAAGDVNVLVTFPFK